MYSTLNGSKTKVMPLQSNIKWYQEYLHYLPCINTYLQQFHNITNQSPH